MKTQKDKVIGRLIKAIGYSIAGFQAAWKNEESFRQETILTLFIIPAGLLLGTTASQRALLIGTWLLVVTTELLNSAIEAMVDRMGKEQHVLSGRAKDLASAAVFVSILATLIVWGLIAEERFFG